MICVLELLKVHRERVLKLPQPPDLGMNCIQYIMPKCDDTAKAISIHIVRKGYLPCTAFVKAPAIINFSKVEGYRWATQCGGLRVATFKKTHRYHWIWECEWSPHHLPIALPILLSRSPESKWTHRSSRGRVNAALKGLLCSWNLLNIYLSRFSSIFSMSCGMSEEVVHVFFHLFADNCPLNAWHLETGHLRWSAKHHVAFTLQRCLKSF